ncbi:hypothetical protein BCR32DRAFT_278288 [Anaeromyces robustus]|uniref:L domain-like protein n=1 Tax=Anaeromyces robustus TaxID=1754192 RepID=A0A1Y1XBN8_9FUNG|nr:hypothetical protein BCR32DRAFT_278288 [Anaeromyces robustus]|eukprot:ORX83133.1 hypothetical protein BCR32DRAFT_278288 [Anaeromyces robustus]
MEGGFQDFKDIDHNIGINGIDDNKKILSLKVNALEIIPKEIGNLMNLNFIGFSQNSLKSIPEEIYCLKKLKNISYNKIEEIPKEIACLENLERLYLNDNELKDIPKKIETLNKFNSNKN